MNGPAATAIARPYRRQAKTAKRKPGRAPFIDHGRQPCLNDSLMEAVTILRELWRRRVLVGALAIVCVLVGLALTYTVSFPPESRKYEVSIATARILVDTPDSQVVDVAPRGSDTLGMRANLFANLMVAGNVKAIIARKAGLRPGQLQAGVESEATVPAALTSALENPNAHVLTTRVTTSADGVLPIVELEAQAPDAKGAVKVASAAVVGLRTYLDSKAATEDIEHARRLRVTGLGTPQVEEAVRGPRRLVALGAAVFLFCLGCAAIALGPRLAGSWRAAAARDRAATGAPGQRVLELPVEGREAGTSSAKVWLRNLWGRPTRPPAAATTPTAHGEAGTNGDGAHSETSDNDVPRDLQVTLVRARRPAAAAPREASANGDGVGADDDNAPTEASDDDVPRELPVTLVRARRPAAARTAAAPTEASTNGDGPDAAADAPSETSGDDEGEGVDSASTVVRSV